MAGATARGEVIVGFSAEISKLTAGMKQVQATMGAVKGSVDKAGQSVTDMVTGLGAAMGARKVYNLGRQMVRMASDLGETTNKVGELFEGSAKDVTTWAKGAADNFGLSTQAALDSAAGFAVFGKSAGMTGAELSSFSTGLVGLSADLASFHNAAGGAQEVAWALQSALRGEYEPARRFGYVINDASMKQQALAMGMKLVNGNLTQQQKILVLSKLLYRDAGDALGDFARTSTGLANSQRIMKAHLDNLKSEIGQALIPAVAAATTGMVTLLQVVSLIPAPIREAATVFGFMASGALLAAVAVAKFKPQVDAATAAISKLAKTHPVLLGIGIAITAVTAAWTLWKSKREKDKAAHDAWVKSIQAATVALLEQRAAANGLTPKVFTMAESWQAVNAAIKAKYDDKQWDRITTTFGDLELNVNDLAKTFLRFNRVSATSNDAETLAKKWALYRTELTRLGWSYADVTKAREAWEGRGDPGAAGQAWRDLTDLQQRQLESLDEAHRLANKVSGIQGIMVDTARSLASQMPNGTNALREFLGVAEGHGFLSPEELAKAWGKFLDVGNKAPTMWGRWKNVAIGVVTDIAYALDSKGKLARDAVAGLTDQLKGQADAWKWAGRGAEAYADSIANVARPARSLLERQWSMEEAFEGWTSAVGKSGKVAKKGTAEYRSQQRALLEVGDAAQQNVGAFYAQTGSIEAAQKAADMYRQQIVTMGQDAGMAQQDIDMLVSAMGLLPTQVEASLKLTEKQKFMEDLAVVQLALEAFDNIDPTVKASIATAIMRGDMESAMTMLQDIANGQPVVIPTKVRVPVIAIGSTPPGAKYDGSGNIVGWHSGAISYTVTGYQLMRRGGRYTGQDAIVGDAGPEFFTADKAGRIYTSSELARAMQSSAWTGNAGGGGVTIGQVTVHASGAAQGAAAGRALVAELKRYERRNGRRWRNG